MHTKDNDLAGKPAGIVAKIYRKIVRDIQEKRIQKQRTQLYAALLLGSIRRIK